MQSKKAALFLSVTFFLISAFISDTSYSQVRKHNGVRHRSYYFSGGLNKAQFFNSTINVDQKKLGNNYDLSKVKGANTFSLSSFKPQNLNYRVGYYFNYEQTAGFELSYDPVNYHITDGQSLGLKGTYNGAHNVNTTIVFASKDGYKYSMSGANFLLLNFVRRFTIYRPNSNRVGIDAIGKLGAGPLMPEFVSSLPGNPMDAPAYQVCGWNGAGEAALRLTIYRYGYVEIAEKYDYALYNNLQVYGGIAKQNLATLETILCIGFTFPSNRFNPLFHHERNIITIIPFFQDKKDRDSTDSQEYKDKRDAMGDEDQLQDIPEFQSVKDRKARFQEQVDKIISDSLANQARIDSIAHQVIADSIANKEMSDSVLRKSYNDSLEALQVKRDTIGINDSTLKPADTSGVPPHEETKRERKARLKKEKAAARQKEKDAANAPAGGETPTPPPAEAPPATPPTTPPAETPAPPEEQKSEKQLRKEKEKQDREAQEKIDQDKKTQDAKEQDAKDKAEQDSKDQAAKEKQDQKDKEQAQKEKDKEDAKAKKAQEKADKKAKKEQEKAEKKAKKEQEKKDKEEQKAKEQAAKEEKKDTPDPGK